MSLYDFCHSQSTCVCVGGGSLLKSSCLDVGTSNDCDICVEFQTLTFAVICYSSHQKVVPHVGWGINLPPTSSVKDFCKCV